MSDDHPPKSDGPNRSLGELLLSVATAVASKPGSLPSFARIAADSVARAATDIAGGSVGPAADLAKLLDTSSGSDDTDKARAEAARTLDIDEQEMARTRGVAPGDLRRRGRDLLKMSYSPALQPKGDHPAFARILDDLTPDEARILRFLEVAGTQPAIDVRTKKLFGIGSVLVGSGFSMIARMAGCINKDQDAEYLANLERLGLVSYSHEAVVDPRRYSLIECQPKAMEALFGSGRKTYSVYRSVELTTFGERFCEYCIDTEGFEAGGWDTDPRGDVIFISKRRRRKLAERAGGGPGHH